MKLRTRRYTEPAITIVLVAGWLSLTSVAFSQQAPDASLKSLQASHGLSVSLWASEPMVNNPTAMDIDSRGRVWIAEGLNYRMKMKQFENLHRIEQADRIKVLEDTDGDGKADKVTVFAEKIFPVPLGLAVEEIWRDGKQTGTRVYVGNSPDLLVLEDTNGDDIADNRSVLLTGFRGIDSDHGLHGMTIGLDGKLCFTVGDARYGADNVQMREPTFDVTDKSGRRFKADNFGTTLRCNRDGTQLEVLTSGHRNNYEAATDSFGNIFGSDNDDDGNRGCRMYWVMDGGRYGYQTPASTRHWAEELPGIIPKLVGTGNGAPAGLTVYEGDHLPPEYFGAVLQIDSGTHQVNLHPLVREGGGFRSDYQVLLKSDDDWFRPVDISVAPDGSLFVCDWYDAGVGGNRFTDQTTGRIYRLAKPNSAGSTQQAPRDLISKLRSPNRCTQIAARDEFVRGGASSRDILHALFQSGQPHERARALQVLMELPQTGHTHALAALQDSDPRIRELAVQTLVHDAAEEFLVKEAQAPPQPVPALKHIKQLLPLAKDPDAGVRRALLLGLRRAPTSDVGEALMQLAFAWDGKNRFYLEAIRSAIIQRERDFAINVYHPFVVRSMESPSDRETATVPAPPFFPTVNNDSYFKIGDTQPEATYTSKLVGIVWALKRPDSIKTLRIVLMRNLSPALERAAVEALQGIQSQEAVDLLIERFYQTHLGIPVRQFILQKMSTLLATSWSAYRNEVTLENVIDMAWQVPELRLDAIQAVGKLQLKTCSQRLIDLVNDSKADEQERAMALTSLGRLRDPNVVAIANLLLEECKEKPACKPLTLSAIEALAAMEQTQSLEKLLVDKTYPEDARRTGLQLLCGQLEGAQAVLKLYQQRTQDFSEALQNELRFLLHNHGDRRVRQLAQQQLPLDQSAASRRIHDYQTLMPLTGSIERGRKLFETHAEALCARCHRVDGKGVLVGPDLSTIGTKYGARELLYHIQNPSGAINYNFASQTFLLDDGRVQNGIILRRENGKITLGLPNGQQMVLEETNVESQKANPVSIMPEGLIANMNSQQVADLLEYLQSLR